MRHQPHIQGRGANRVIWEANLENRASRNLSMKKTGNTPPFPHPHPPQAVLSYCSSSRQPLTAAFVNWLVGIIGSVNSRFVRSVSDIGRRSLGALHRFGRSPLRA